MPFGSALGASPRPHEPAPTRSPRLRALSALEHCVLTDLAQPNKHPRTPYLYGVSATHKGRLVAGAWLEPFHDKEAIVRAVELAPLPLNLLLTLYHERWHLGATRHQIKRLWQPLQLPKGFGVQAYLQQQLWQKRPDALPLKLHALGFRAQRSPQHGWMLALEL